MGRRDVAEVQISMQTHRQRFLCVIRADTARAAGRSRVQCVRTGSQLPAPPSAAWRPGPFMGPSARVRLPPPRRSVQRVAAPRAVLRPNKSACAEGAGRAESCLRACAWRAGVQARRARTMWVYRRAGTTFVRGHRFIDSAPQAWAKLSCLSRRSRVHRLRGRGIGERRPGGRHTPSGRHRPAATSQPRQGRGCARAPVAWKVHLNRATHPARLTKLTQVSRSQVYRRASRCARRALPKPTAAIVSNLAQTRSEMAASCPTPIDLRRPRPTWARV